MAEQLEIEDFDTAKAIFEKLKDVPTERRKRILSWVAEGLGAALQAPPTHAALHTSAAPATAAVPMAHASQTPATDIKNFCRYEGTEE